MQADAKRVADSVDTAGLAPRLENKWKFYFVFSQNKLFLLNILRRTICERQRTCILAITLENGLINKLGASKQRKTRIKSHVRCLQKCVFLYLHGITEPPTRSVEQILIFDFTDSVGYLLLRGSATYSPRGQRRCIMRPPARRQNPAPTPVTKSQRRHARFDLKLC